MILDILFLVVGALHVFVAPFTKVEESFNLHATHDVLMYGIFPENLDNYDHFLFPGVVPRSFAGSLLLAYASTPVLWLLQQFDLLKTKFEIQITVRLVLAALNAFGLILVRRAIHSRFGPREALWFTLLSCTQFHLPFWMGRTLPNMFALFPMNIAFYLLLRTSRHTARDTHLAIGIMAVTAVVLRSEIIALLAPVAIQALLKHRISFRSAFSTGLICTCFAIAFTTSLDSYFWRQRLLWPEFSAVYFNVYEGKSSEWGVSPVHAYVTSHLPKLLLGSAPLSILGFLVDTQVRGFMLPAAICVGLLSLLGHKEWRFIVYVIPIFNVAAARGAAWILERKKSLKRIRRHMTIALYGLLLINFIVTAFLTYISHLNYPGGEALSKIHTLVNAQSAEVYIDDLAAQSGASLFLQEYSPPLGRFGISHSQGRTWKYHKTEPVGSGVKLTHSIRETNKGKEALGVVQAIERVQLHNRDAVDKWQRWIPHVVLRDALWIARL